MEDKFDQIEMDVGDVADIVDAEEPATTPDETTPACEEAPRPPKQQSPENVKIGEGDYAITSELDEDIELITPDADIFEREIDNAQTSDMAHWTHEVIKRDKESEAVEFDDMYANSSHADQEFMKAFGISDKDGNVTINVDDSLSHSSAEIETLQGDIHSDYYEYTDRQQRKEIIGMYKYAMRSIRTKIIMSGIFALFLLLIENIGLFSKNASGIFNIAEHPYLHFFLDFGAFAICALFAYEQIYHGIKSIISKEYIPEAIAVFGVAMGIVYSIFNLIFIPFKTPVLCNFPAAVMCVLTIVFSYINVARERYSFSVISSKDSKFVLNKVEADDADAETEAFSTASRDFVGDLIRVDKADFVRKYFARTNKSVSTVRMMYPYYILAVCVPLILAIISIFRNAHFMDAMLTWYNGVMLVLPVGLLFMYSVPFFMGNRHLYEEETSIIGEGTIYEYASAKAVSVNDTTAFPPYNVKLQGFNVYNDYKPEKVLYYASNGFNVVGGPLADVFGTATKDAFTKSKRARFVCSGRSYLCVKVDNDTIIFADRYGISSNGIEISYDREDADEDVCVMYMACNGKLCARMYIKYTIDEDFAQTVRSLNKNGISVGIRTFDPNLDNELLKLQTGFKKSDLRIIRLSRDIEIPRSIEKTDSGVVSKGHSKSLIKAIPVCKNIAKIRKVGAVLNIIASIVGVVLLGLVTFASFLTLNPLLIVGYYVVWLLIMFIVTSVMLLQ